MTSLSFTWPIPVDISKPGKSNLRPCIMCEFAHFPLVTGVTDVTLRTAPPGRDGRSRAARHAPRGRPAERGLEDRLRGLHGPGQRQARAHRPRLRTRPRDVAVRGAGGGSQGADLSADRGLLLPGHEPRLGHRLDPGADL